jgi:hypothetical protein
VHIQNPCLRERVRVRVRARGGCVMPTCTTCVCIDARASRRVRMPRCAHTHTHIGGSMCVWRQPYPRACAYGWMYMHACIDGSASTGVHRYACICVYVERYLYHYYTSIMHLHACIMYGPIAALCTQVSMSVCTQTDRYRWVHVYLAPSVQPNM